MSKKKTHRTPSFRHHKASRQGFVELDGRRIYLGRHDRPETKQRYHRLVAEWIANGRQLAVDPEEMTIVELVARFWNHATEYYRRPDGTATSELGIYRLVLRPLKELYGDAKATAFGPRSLKAVRQRMIEIGWCRSNVNKSIGRIKAVFRWGTENELLPPSVYHGLQAVSGLKRGRSEARESEPIKPVADAHIAAVKPFVSRQVWALIQLQLRTAARSGELVTMRAIDIDTGGEVWTYRPTHHKTAHHGRERVIYIGPTAQEILAPFMADRSVDAPLFSPSEAERERYDMAETHRRKNQKPTPRLSDRVVAGTYSADSYRRSVDRACRAAMVPVWSPHRLRHNAATLIRRDHGVEAAQLMLGHARADVTQVYAEADEGKARMVALAVG